LKYEKSLKNRAKRASKILVEKLHSNLSTSQLPFLKGLAGARGGSPKPCERLAQHKNKVYRQAE